jgi:hypothetical protein
VETKRLQIRCAASALVQQGHDPAAITGLATLVAVDAFKAIVRFFLARTGGKTSTQVHGIASTLKAIAKYWVKVAPDHLQQLTAFVRSLTPKKKGMTRKNRERLRQFDHGDSAPEANARS